MPKPLLQLALTLFLAIPAMAQRPAYPKLFPDPQVPGRLIDSSQWRLLKIRETLVSKELKRIKDSINNLYNAKIYKPSNANKTSISNLNATISAILNTNTTSLSNYKTLSNNCGLKASFTPGNDTTLYTGQQITFTNTSQNGDSYEWVVDVYSHYISTDFSFVPAIGVTQVLLIAHNGDCADTATTYVVRNGTPPTSEKRTNISYGLPNSNEWASAMVNAKKDGYLLAGVSGIGDWNGYNTPYFVRISENGCILWSKLLGQLGRGTQVHSLITTYDSGFVAQVVLDGDNNSYLVKLDKNGNMLWAKNYRGDKNLEPLNTIHELPDHSLMIVSNVFATNKNFQLTHLDEQGNFLWQKEYLISDVNSTSFNDLVEKNGYLYVSGTYYEYIGNGNSNYVPMLIKVDASNGNLQWSRGYNNPYSFNVCQQIRLFKDGLLMSGFAASPRGPAGGWIYFPTLLETDIDGNPRDGKIVFSPDYMDIARSSELIVDPDNTIEFFYSGTQLIELQPGIVPLNYFMRMDASKNILWQEKYYGYFVGDLSQAAPAPDKGMAMLGDRGSSLSNPTYGLSTNLFVLKVDSNGTGPDDYCNIYPTNTYLLDMPTVPYVTPTPVVTDQTLQVTNQNPPITNPNSELRYYCPDYVPLCSFMKLTGKNFVCNLKDTFDFIAHKDPSCGDPVNWTYDALNIKTAFKDGSKLRLLFQTPGVYKIRAEKPFPCTPIVDSIMVTVAPALVNFNLGRDTTLCSGDSITLRPQGKFDHYRWQDLSVNDSFKVKTAGQYFVMVTDSCGNTKSDTVEVSYKPPIALDLGAPRLKCKSDHLLVIAPDGFLKYDWSPSYNMLVSSIAGEIIVFPDRDTTYKLTVSDIYGCTGSSTLRINNYPMSDLSLGNDTTICAGADIVFTASGNFDSYTWSNSATSSSIDVRDGGKYSVLVKDQNGCPSSDTVALTISPPPGMHISGGSAICKNQDLILDAGPGFTSYNWQDGSHDQQFKVIDTGYYRVWVTDNHQCLGADSIHIANYAESPSDFLPADTTVCLYRGGNIQSTKEFASYIWSTGETGRSIFVKTAGQYSLQVENAEGCKASESITVKTKDCEALFVFPNAFSPNGDGVNDIFHLKYPGFAADYQLQVFNRWGQAIYRSADPWGQWDGRVNGEIQPAGTYVWIVHYTDRAGAKQKLSGSVVLIR